MGRGKGDARWSTSPRHAASELPAGGSLPQPAASRQGTTTAPGCSPFDQPRGSPFGTSPTAGLAFAEGPHRRQLGSAPTAGRRQSFAGFSSPAGWIPHGPIPVSWRIAGSSLQTK
jgi:hypothetical protein